MIKPDAEAFLQLPSVGPHRVLFPGHLIEVSADGYGGLFQLGDQEVCVGTELQLYFEVGRQFSFQPVRVESACAESEGVRVALAVLGDPVPVETRQSYRVSALAANLRCTLGGEAGCEVLDVSATGFSLYAGRRHEIGSTVEAVLHFEREHFPGRVVIQSLRRISGTRVRYGVHAADRAGAVLNHALPRINLAIQRQQLRRRTGDGT